MLISKVAPRRRWVSIVVTMAFGAGCATTGGPSIETQQVATATVAATPLRAAPPLSCPPPIKTSVGIKHVSAEDDSKARTGAQRGLGFVAKETIAWQKQNNCYGCHVQAVTLEALSVGRHNQYDIPNTDFEEVLRGLLHLPGGARGPNGLSLSGGTSLIETSKEFGGAAFARYDEFVNSAVRDDLMKVAQELVSYQNPDGSMQTSDTRFPVEAGLMQSTTQAMQTWRQAYSRSADERWLAPLRKAESYLQMRAAQLTDESNANMVDLNYAVIGLLSAGAQSSETTMRTIANRLRKAQRSDGGWGFSDTDESNAFATGQTLYALRLAGANDSDAAISKGTAWLLAHQAADGGWSHAGRGKAEAMWAVLGLVSIDVLSVAVNGVEDGQHLSGHVPIKATASDNRGRGVERIELMVDDVAVHRACGAQTEYSLDTASLEAGVHTVDVLAINDAGQKSRRRIEVYAGAYYLTQIGTRFTDGGTLVSLRNVAPKSMEGKVMLKVYATRENDGKPVKTTEIYRMDAVAKQGAMQFFWNGKDTEGKAQSKGRYMAELSYVDGRGKAVHTSEMPFVHDTLEAQEAAFGEIAGSLNLDGAGPSSNTQVDLLDEQGRVVQSVKTTESGNYRFRNVDQGKYKVRVSKKGFQAAEAPAAAAPAMKATAAPIDLKAQ